LRSVEECYRGRDVRVFRLDADAVMRRLRERARALVDGDPRVAEVRLFGSLARGEARPGSDADLFIVVRDPAAPFAERIACLARWFTGTGIGCDVIAYTESEVAQARARGDAFIRTLARDGISLAGRHDVFARDT